MHIGDRQLQLYTSPFSLQIHPYYANSAAIPTPSMYPSFRIHPCYKTSAATQLQRSISFQMHSLFYRFHSNCNSVSTVSKTASAAVLKLPISRTHTHAHAKVRWFSKCRVSLSVSLFFTHAHFSVSHLYTTYLAVHTRDGQPQLYTTPTSLQTPSI